MNPSLERTQCNLKRRFCAPKNFAISALILSLFIFSGCDKKKKEKFGVHDHPVFLEQCGNAIYSSIFEEPRGDPFQEIHFEWLKSHHPKIFAYGEKNRDILSRELMLAAAVCEKFQINPSQSVVFIGATDGELLRLFSDGLGVQNITVIDLSSCIDVVARKLMGFPIRWITPHQIEEEIKADFVISGSTFSRLSESWQKYLFETVLVKAKRGALFYESTPRHWGVKSWKKERFLSHLKNHFHIISIDQEFPKFLTEDTRSLILFAQ